MQNPLSQKAIGVFDSGIGGLTVLKEISDRLPREDLIYLGDTARLPYGNKSRETVTRYSLENARFLIQRGVKLIVVACNTASAFSLQELQTAVEVPVIGVLLPGAQAALAVTRSEEIGVIGTEGTVASASYLRAIQHLKPAARVWALACPLFVPLVEEGWLENEITEAVVKRYLSPLLTTPMDTLILGCTHYPLLKPVIRRVVGPSIHLVDSAEETAKAVAALLQEKEILNSSDRSGNQTLFVTDAPERFKQVGKGILKRSLEDTILVSV